ncbi:Vacuolar protein sorting-associated protein 62 [Emydomyces testavorans]|uniref:Vacuolar protein sorting-associated protein 62 n=1 Tax=Emydomyces testavorans TaxID=2070801 RepID=A0AAF0DGS9_9EURO|nr:Vacuolar protein sorting-associated protein 62 [Emydomyces testavorans]
MGLEFIVLVIKSLMLEESNPIWELSSSGSESGAEGTITDDQTLHDIPDYVLDYAPLVHLFSGENYWPCDIGEHLKHITPYLNYTPLRATWEHPALDNLDELNKWQNGRHVFLTSNDNVEDQPDWLTGKENIPASPDTTVESHFQRRRPFDTLSKKDHVLGAKGNKDKQGGRSDAPAILVVIDKGNGIVDAFWFYFYSYNLGNTVLNVRFGNHVGDWEHSLVRFHNGKPKAIFLSEHAGGAAYTYEAVEKIGKRPVIYSATGTHAMYANPGVHAYILPWGLLHDETDAGPLWDPSLNLHAYTYSLHNDTLHASTLTPHSPTGWFYFLGHWGDKIYPLSDSRQYTFAGQYHYVSGPLGPRFKDLGRRKLCQGSEEAACVIRGEIGSVDEPRVVQQWNLWDTGLGEDDDREDVD